jgi:hypothetical protein
MVETWRKSSHSGGTNGACVEVAWRKSSYSGGTNGDCVEISWRKSSYSNGGNGDCVEVAVRPERVGVRDSKNADGPTLAFSPTTWRAFLADR